MRQGLRPVGPILSARMYKMAAAYATALYIGDPVLRDGSGDIIIATAGFGQYVLGAALGFFTTEFVPLATNYYVAATAGVHYCLVADDINQLFVVQEDSNARNLAVIDMGTNVDLIATAAGSTLSGLSGWELDSSSIGNGATVQMRIISQYREISNTVPGTNASWICKINYHQGLQGTVGVGV